MLQKILSFVIESTLYVVTFVYDVATFPIYFIVNRPWKVLNLSRKIKSKVIKADSNQITLKSTINIGEEHSFLLRENIDTLEKVLSLMTKIHASKNCLGTREILAEQQEQQPDGKVHKKYVMGDYKWRTFSQTEQEAQHFGKGVRELGVKTRDRVAIFSETRAEWMIAAHGLFKQSCAVATIYATLGDDGVVHAINQAEVSVLITSHDLMPKLKNVIQKIPKVTTVIYFEDQLNKTILDGMEQVKVLAYKDVLEIGQKSKVETFSPVPEDVAIIMFTSGSTGVPKGVVLSHKNLMTVMSCFMDCIKAKPTDVILGFLPLAHSFELLIESTAMIYGVPIGYSSPLTLIDSSPKIAKGQVGDAKLLKPTAMAIVPLIMERIVKGIDDRVQSGSLLQKTIFKFAYEYKKKWYYRGYKTPITDRLVFKKIAELMGGQMRGMMSGGAPLSPETHDRIKLYLNMITVQGYGLTETSAGASVPEEFDISVGRVGGPLSRGMLRLVNWEEGGYFVTNKPYPQGEILIGGDNVCIGYYKMPEETAETFFVDEDGVRWMRSGDIGEIQADGALKIIDRKKDLVKLQHGEYLSLGKIEAELKTCQIIENVCVYADSSKNYCIALIQPAEKALRDIASPLGFNTLISFAELCQNNSVVDAALKAIAKHGKAHGLNKFEIPTRIALCTDVWTPDSGLVTAAYKIKRKEVVRKYKDVIDAIYK